MQLVITDKCKKLELSLEQTQEVLSVTKKKVYYLFFVFTVQFTLKKKKNLCLRAETTHTHIILFSVSFDLQIHLEDRT